MPARPSHLAILIDLGLEEPRLFGRVLAKATTYGDVAIQRVYGDCKKLRDWEGCLQYRGIESKANYGDGPNAADITLIIDAVDLLRSGRVDGFCIMASDHHFTGLVRWLHDNDTFVAGIGRPNASPELQEAFGDYYTNVEDLPEWDGAYGEAERNLVERIKNAIGDSPEWSGGYAHLSTVKSHMGIFSVRDYCHGGFTSLVDSYGEFEVRGGESIGLPDGNYVRIKPLSE